MGETLKIGSGNPTMGAGVGGIGKDPSEDSSSSAARRISRLFSSSVSQFSKSVRQSLDSVQLNPDTRHIVMVSAVLLADVCFLTITVSLPGLLFATIVVPLAILNQNNKASPIDYTNLTFEKTVVIASAVFADLCFLAVVMSPASLLFSTIVVPITLFRYLQDDVLDLRIVDEKGQQKEFKRLTVKKRLAVKEGGNFSFVIKGSLDDGQKVVLKVFRTAAEINAQNPEEDHVTEEYVTFLREREIKHLRIVKDKKIKGALQLHDKVVIVGDQHFGIVTDFAGEDFRNWADDEKNLITPEAVTRFAGQILNTLRQIHEEAELVHGDGKPENFLIDENGDVTVIDFGLSAKNTGTSYATANTEYLAPECLLRQEQDAKVDIWALGCTFFEFIEGPLGDERLSALENEGSLYKLMQDFVIEIEKINEREEGATKEEQTQAVTAAFQRRIDRMVDALAKVEGDNNDFTTATSLIKKMLLLDSRERPTARKAFQDLQHLVVEDVKKKYKELGLVFDRIREEITR